MLTLAVYPRNWLDPKHLWKKLMVRKVDSFIKDIINFKNKRGMKRKKYYKKYSFINNRFHKEYDIIILWGMDTIYHPKISQPAKELDRSIVGYS